MSQERRCRSSSGADIRHNEGGSDELEWFKATFSISPRVMPISISSLSVKIAQMTLQPLSFAPLLKCTPPSFQRAVDLSPRGCLPQFGGSVDRAHCEVSRLECFTSRGCQDMHWRA